MSADICHHIVHVICEQETPGEDSMFDFTKVCSGYCILNEIVNFCSKLVTSLTNPSIFKFMPLDDCDRMSMYYGFMRCIADVISITTKTYCSNPLSLVCEHNVNIIKNIYSLPFELRYTLFFLEIACETVNYNGMNNLCPDIPCISSLLYSFSSDYVVVLNPLQVEIPIALNHKESWEYTSNEPKLNLLDQLFSTFCLLPYDDVKSFILNKIICVIESCKAHKIRKFIGAIKDLCDEDLSAILEYIICLARLYDVSTIKISSTLR